mmetsp:Transcript_6614/g.27493  ORF Transcript_6614/g.27493 Transcript_6614/m.27493 type:complete len:235 (-) Transcript_6614:91-795(-)
MALLVVLDLDAHADALEAGVVEVDRGFGGSLVTSVLLDEGPELDGDVVLVVADPDVGVLADEVVVDGTGEVGVDVGEGNVGGDADSVVVGARILVVEGLVACLDGGDCDVANLVDVGLDLDAGGVVVAVIIAVVAGDGNVAGLASELDASLGELDVDIPEVADVGDVRDRIALEVQLLLPLIVCGGETGGGPEGHGATVGKAGRGGEGELLVADSAVAVGGDPSGEPEGSFVHV